MIDIFLFIVTIVIVFRTISYGFWTLSVKNIAGGIFILFLSLLTASLSVYLLISGRT